MIPLVGIEKELKFVKKIIVETADAEIKAAGSDLKYEVGTMIEIPRAALQLMRSLRKLISSASVPTTLLR
jgi:phosphoenolpyruvate-protein kinase (PTS system EI component)